MHESILPIVSILGGLVLLVAGGELLVRGASRLAAAVRISPLVIGLTVVAFGTSAPELAVSVQAALAGSGDIALGNVIGSNIFNVLFILGISAIIVPLVVSSQLVRRDVPLMIAASVLLLVLSLDSTIDRLDGLLLFSGIVFYTSWCVWQSRREHRDVQVEFAQQWPQGKPSAGLILLQMGFIVAGLVLLGVGSRFLVSGAVTIAERLGVSELVIGLTIVAAGTSLPEVVTSIVAALRGERDIAVGNIVGSNLFNILCVLGMASLIAPHGIQVSTAILQFDLPVMIAVAVACLPIFFSGHLISRWEGCLFFFYYLVYTADLVLSATGHEFGHTLRAVIVVFVIPLTVITLVITCWRGFRERQASHSPPAEKSAGKTDA
jgi:cation:H+ antiporter